MSSCLLMQLQRQAASCYRTTLASDRGRGDQAGIDVAGLLQRHIEQLK